ncbi:MAG: Elongation factor P [Candidatus Curtissbacteria bacterium GW2011_GWA1_41_11]|uniref:Elongation factor P n=1 Tax=Candidatus Curtissbacteria bacterium GW2011_GWA1_41_11 TaxID=1618409 RepID=A0A0G0XIG0_9BACT|nr:MAG: Elongation factor P [Candidatus Curtissbacteria bacterium GW2011_GWA1_41_11]
MISVTDLRSGVVFEENNQYLLVLSYEHIKVARGSGTVKVKVQNLETGANIEKSFQTGARVQNVNVERKKVQYLYTDDKVHVMDMTSYEQFELDRKLVEDMAKYLKEGLEITLFSVEGKPLYLEIPKIIDFKVTQTGGSARGNTVGASYKDAVLENGLVVKVPLFLKNGEMIRVDTRSGEYVERAK